MNVDPELRKRVEQIKSSPVQVYREAGDYSNRELVEGIVVSPEDIAAIEAVAREQALDVELIPLARALAWAMGPDPKLVGEGDQREWLRAARAVRAYYVSLASDEGDPAEAPR
jgi:hypothetical protein